MRLTKRRIWLAIEMRTALFAPIGFLYCFLVKFDFFSLLAWAQYAIVVVFPALTYNAIWKTIEERFKPFTQKEVWNAKVEVEKWRTKP